MAEDLVTITARTGTRQARCPDCDCMSERVHGGYRRYTLTDDGTLTFVHDLEAVGQPLQHHLSARLRRREG